MTDPQPARVVYEWRDEDGNVIATAYASGPLRAEDLMAQAAGPDRGLLGQPRVRKSETVTVKWVEG